MNVKGTYEFTIPVQTMFLDEKLVISGENIVTQMGECFLMNRWVNSNEDVIQYIVLGKGTKRPTKNDLDLAVETVRKPISYEVQAKRNCLEISANFTGEEVIGTTEITRDAIVNDLTSSVNLTYRLNLMSGSYRNGWKQSDGYIYYIYEPVQVLGVYEANTDSGYTKKDSLEEMGPGTYYFNWKSRTLYVWTTRNSDPNYEEIVVDT